MSNCTIEIKVNGKILKMDVDSDPSSNFIDNDFLLALAHNPDVSNKLIQQILDSNVNYNSRKINIEDIKKNGIQANYNLAQLRNDYRWASAEIPEGVNADILMINNLVINGQPISGRVIDNNGRELFIVKNNLQDVTRLSNFLKVRNAITDSNIELVESSPYYADVKELLLFNPQITSVANLLVDYVENKNKYAGVILKSGNSAIFTLENIIRNLQDYNNANESIQLQQFKSLLSYIGDKQAYISYDDLTSFVNYNLGNNFLTEISGSQNIDNNFYSISNIDDIISSNPSMINYLKSKPEVKVKKDSKFYNIEYLLKTLLSKDPAFDFECVGATTDGIVIKSNFKSIPSNQDIAFNTTHPIEVSKYKGFRINKTKTDDGQNVFYISKGVLSNDDMKIPYNSISEVCTSIDNIVFNQPLLKESLVDFKFRNKYKDSNGKIAWDQKLPQQKVISWSKYKKGQIIASLNIPIDKSTIINNTESSILYNNNSTIVDFYNLVNSWDINPVAKSYIKDKISDPESAVAYIYKVNDILGTNDRTNSRKLQEIAEGVDRSGTNYYYIEDTKYIPFKGYAYTVIPVNIDQVEQYQEKHELPTSTWMSAIATSLESQFGVRINLVTSGEVKDDFKDIANPNFDKAFIYNGEIYVNTSIASTTDLLHEHVHLILGVLKTNPELRSNYEGLLQMIVNTKEGQETLNKIKDQYIGLSQMDLAEEVFANLFSEYVRNNTSGQTEQIFTASEEQLQKLTSSIFNTNITNIKSFYNRSLIDTFGRFNTEVVKLLNEQSIDFETTQKSRKVSSWISKQIKDGNIIEEC